MIYNSAGLTELTFNCGCNKIHDHCLISLVLTNKSTFLNLKYECYLTLIAHTLKIIKCNY